MKDSQDWFDLSKVVFVTNSLSGHRLTWFLNIYNLQIGKKRPINLILVGGSSNPDYDSLLFRVYPALSGDHMIQIAKSLFNEQGALKFIFLDGEQWVKHLIRVQFPSRILIMRPFISTFNVVSFLKYVVKNIILSCLRRNKNIKIGFLKIPHHKSLMRKSGWISDNLTTSDINIEGLSKKNGSNRIMILIPGFINERKQPRLILKIAAGLEKDFPNVFQFSFLGSVDTKTKELITSASLPNVVFEDRYLERPEYLSKIFAADVILLLYKNRSASGIVMEALAMNKSVLVQKSYLWKGLLNFSHERLTFMPRNRRQLLEPFRYLTQSKQSMESERTTLKYEFLDKDDPLGLINFIYSS